MADRDRLVRAFIAADDAGDTESAAMFAQAIRDADAGGAPEGLRTGEQPAIPERDYSPLERFDLLEDTRAVELYNDMLDTQQGGDEEEAHRAQVRLTGYIDGRRRSSGSAEGGALDANASRAESALRGVGQGIFGAGDFAASLGSWLGDGGPMGDFSLRDHFAFQRHRREGMSAENPISSGTGYVAGLLSGGGAVQAGVRVGARNLPGAGGQAARALQVTPGGSRALNVGRNALGSATASTAAAGLEEGEDAKLGQAAVVGAIAGPVGERVLQTGVSGIRRLGRRIGPGSGDRAAAAELARRGMDRGERVGTGGAERIARSVDELGPGASIGETLNAPQARQLGESASASEDAVDLLQQNLTSTSSRRADRVSDTIQGDEVPVSSDAIRARETARSQSGIRQEEDALSDDLFTIRREGVRDRATQRAAQEEARDGARTNIGAATERLQQRLARTADTGRDNVEPERIISARDQFANEVMGEIGEASVTVADAGNLLGRDAVRGILRRYASAAEADEADAIRALLDVDGDDLSEAVLSLRQIDAFRQTASKIGADDPAIMRGLTNVADALDTAARKQVPAYDDMMRTYASLSRRAEGSQAGFGVLGAQPSRLAAQRDIAGAQGPEFDEGLQTAAQRAVADAVRSSPDRALRVARDITNDARRFETAMGPRFDATSRAAREGVDEVAEAEMALTQLQRLQRADADALRQVTEDRVFARTQEGRERVRALTDQIESRMQPIQRAEQVLRGDTANFTRARDMAAQEGMADEFAGVARTTLAQSAGESGVAATNVATSLADDPGLRRRVTEAFGEETAQTLFTMGGREARAGRASANIASGAMTNLRRAAEDEQAMLISAVDAGVVSTGRWSGAFGASALIRLYRLMNGDKERAIALANALTSGDEAVVARTLARLEQLGASRQVQQEFAEAAGIGAGIAAGQAQRPRERDER